MGGRASRLGIWVHLSLASQSINEAHVWEHAILILRIAKFSKKLLDILLGDLISLSLSNTGLLGDVQAQGVADVSKEEEIDLTFAVPIVDVADVFNLSLINHLYQNTLDIFSFSEHLDIDCFRLKLSKMY